MADVFISYAREDQDFVRKLQDALEEHNRDTWIDWKDIPLTAKWKEEVFSAIDNADSFAALISPDFIVSKPCQEELDHAAHDNKRMVPLWHRDVADEEVPPTWPPTSTSTCVRKTILRTLLSACSKHWTQTWSGYASTRGC
jgi:hypothetical protein